MPLDQYGEGGHGEGEAGVTIRPDAVHALCAMADECPYRAHRLDEHPVLPRAARTACEVGGIPLGGMVGSIGVHHEPWRNTAEEGMDG